METIKRNWLKAITGISLVLGLILGVNAFEKRVEAIDIKTEPELKEWHFDGAENPLNNDIADAAQYSEGTSSTCPGVAQTACNLKAPETSPNSGVIDLNYMVPGTGQNVEQRIQSAITSGIANETVLSFRAN